MSQRIVSLQKISVANTQHVRAHLNGPHEGILRLVEKGHALMLPDLHAEGAVATNKNPVQPVLVSPELNIHLDTAALNLVVNNLGRTASAPLLVLNSAITHLSSPSRMDETTTVFSGDKSIAMAGAVSGQSANTGHDKGCSRLGMALIVLWNALQKPSTTFGQVIAMSAACGLDGRRVLADHFNGGVRP